MSIMLWPNNEAAIVFITFIGAFFPILLTAFMAFIRWTACCYGRRRLGAQRGPPVCERDPAGLAAAHFTGLAVGMGVAWVSLIAAEMISGQFGVGYFTWEATRWWTIRDRARHDHDRRPWTGLQRHHPDGRRPPDALARIRTRRQAMMTNTAVNTDTAVNKAHRRSRHGRDVLAPTTTRSCRR